jgi:hypothetical protein
MPDVQFQDLSTVQSNLQQQPLTIASAALIAPQTCLTFITGAAAIVNITPPVSGFHILYFWPLGAFTTTDAGNITTVLTAAVGSPVIAFWNPITKKYILAEIPVAA